MYNNRMKEIRISKGISLKELDLETGISIGYLCHLEKGTRRNPSVQIMDKIAYALDSSILEVFFSK